MCRRNQAVGFVLIAFGAGILVGGWIGSCILQFLAAAVSVCLGIGLLGEKRRHK